MVGNTLRVVQDIATAIDGNGWIVGGFPRDILMGEEPNDIDIFVKGEGEMAKIFNAIANRCGRENIYDISAPDLRNYGDMALNRLIIFRVRGLGYPIQLILRKDEPQTLEDLLSGFDFNFNQAYIDGKGQLHAGLEAGGAVKVVNKEQVSEERQSRFFYKYRHNYEWPEDIKKVVFAERDGWFKQMKLVAGEFWF